MNHANMVAPYQRETRLKVTSAGDEAKVSEGDIVKVITEEPNGVKETITVKKSDGSTLQLMCGENNDSLVSAYGRRISIELF